MTKPLTKICFFLFYLLFGFLGTYLHTASDWVIVIWPTTGLAWFGLVYFGLGFWLWIFALAFTVMVGINHSPLSLGLVLAVGHTIEAALGAYAFKKFTKSDNAFLKLRTTIIFLSLVVTFSTLVGSFFTAAGFTALGLISSTAFWTRWQSAWIGHSMGVLIFGSFLAMWSSDPQVSLTREEWLEAAILSLLAVVVVACAFTPLGDSFRYIKAYCIFPLLVWASIRFAQKGAVTINLVMTGIAIAGILMKHHIFLSTRPNEDTMVVQIFLCVVPATSLVLSAAVREARESLELRKEFFMIASHELRTPMTSLLLQLDLAQRQIKVDSTLAPLGRHIDMSSRQAKRMSRLVEQLFDVTRLEQRSLVLRKEEVDLDQLISEVAERFSKDFDAVGSSFELDLKSKTIGNWDRFRIEQVLENLISNGIKYAPGKPMRIRSVKHGGIARIVVQDGGPGIVKSLHLRIFDRFVRASVDPLFRNKPGLGLGLFIVKKIVEAHLGDIRVESEIGVGTTFIVDLPLNSAVSTT